MLPAPEVEAEPMIELDPVDEAAPELAVESAEESGLGCWSRVTCHKVKIIDSSGWLPLPLADTLGFLSFDPRH